MSVPIHVAAYAGYRANERPCRFTLDDDTHEIEGIEDQWYEPDALYFRVRTTEGKQFVLRCDEAEGAWTLRGGFDGTELIARPGIQLIAVDESQIAQALRYVEYCESCHPEEADILFDWILQEVSGAGEMTDFLMVVCARCPNCKRPVTEKTLVSRHDG